MARLFAAQTVVAGAQFLEDVPVAHGGGAERDAGLAHGDVQTEVAHDRGDQGVLRQGAGILHGQGEDRHDRVTVHHVAVRVDRETPVRVAVVGEAQIGAVLEHGPLQDVQVRGSAAVVDVEPRRLGVDGDDGGTGGAVGVGRRRGGRTVSAVHHHGDAVERGGDGLGEVVLVAGQPVGSGAHAADAGPGRPGGSGVEQGLDPVLLLVGQLDAAGREELDAVVRHGIVRRADHDAEGGVVGVGEVGQRRGGHDADGEHVHAGGRQARHDGRLQHLSAGPRVAADDGDGSGGGAVRSRARGRRAQDGGTRATETHGEVRGDVRVGEASNPVGSEQSAHGGYLFRAVVRVVRATDRRPRHDAGARSRPVKDRPERLRRVKCRGISASSTAMPCGPSSGRTSCARPHAGRA